MKESKRSLLQFIKFGIVGFSSTIINYGIYSLLVLFNVDYALANFISFTISVVNSFIWNNRYVFVEEPSKKRVLWKTFLRTYACYSVTGIFLTTFLLWLWISVCGINKYVAPIINLFFTVPINYFLNKYWAYRTK